jgi:hypothetical protein
LAMLGRCLLNDYQSLSLDIDLAILSTAYLKSESPDRRKANVRFALDTPEKVSP